MKILDMFTLALAGVVAAGIAGQNIGYLPSTKETFAARTGASPALAASLTPTVSDHQDDPEAVGKVFEALRWGFGFDAS